MLADAGRLDEGADVSIRKDVEASVFSCEPSLFDLDSGWETRGGGSGEEGTLLMEAVLVAPGTVSSFPV